MGATACIYYFKSKRHITANYGSKFKVFSAMHQYFDCTWFDGSSVSLELKYRSDSVLKKSEDKDDDVGMIYWNWLNIGS